MNRDDPSGETAESRSDAPSLSERVEASGEFTDALEQSLALVRQHRGLLWLLILAGLVIGIVLMYPYLSGLVRF